MSVPSPNNFNESKDSTRQALLEAALIEFAAHGLDGATVKSIAERAGVNISLVSYHFGGKENLYREILKNFALDRGEYLDRIFKTPQNIDEFRFKLELMIEDFFEEHRKQPLIHQILHRDCFINISQFSDIYQTLFLNIIQKISGFFLQAQKKKLLRQDLDTDIAAKIMLGGLIHMTRMEELAKITKESSKTLQNQKYREKVVKTALEINLQGLLETRPLTEFKPTYNKITSKKSKSERI